jgi:hypothetical protein
MLSHFHLQFLNTFLTQFHFASHHPLHHHHLIFLIHYYHLNQYHLPLLLIPLNYLHLHSNYLTIINIVVISFLTFNYLLFYQTSYISHYLNLILPLLDMQLNFIHLVILLSLHSSNFIHHLLNYQMNYHFIRINLIMMRNLELIIDTIL